jgi:hypothetical protein
MHQVREKYIQETLLKGEKRLRLHEETVLYNNENILTSDHKKNSILKRETS